MKGPEWWSKYRRKPVAVIKIKNIKLGWRCIFDIIVLITQGDDFYSKKITIIHFYSLCSIITKLDSPPCPNCIPDPLIPWCMYATWWQQSLYNPHYLSSCNVQASNNASFHSLQFILLLLLFLSNFTLFIYLTSSNYLYLYFSSLHDSSSHFNLQPPTSQPLYCPCSTNFWNSMTNDQLHQ